MDTWVLFSAQSQVRERLCRAAQYACSLLGHVMQKHGASPKLQKQIRQLEGHLSLGRKLLRLDNSADALESAQRAVHLSDVILRFSITVSHLNRALYFACDNVLWAGKAGLAPLVDQEKWAQHSFRYYLFSLIMNLSRDAYEVRLLIEQESSACGHRSKGSAGGTQGDGEAGGAVGVSAPGGNLPHLALRLRLRVLLLTWVLRSWMWSEILVISSSHWTSWAYGIVALGLWGSVVWCHPSYLSLPYSIPGFNSNPEPKILGWKRV